jgi:protein-disulfide isomerase
MQYSAEKINPKKWYTRWWAFLIFIFFIFICIIAIALAFQIHYLTKQNKNPQSVKLNKSEKYDAEGINNYWTGAKEPKITIVEFADYNCPLCRNSFFTIRELIAEYPEKIKLIFRDYPALTETSKELALAARCSGEQNKFWQMHDKLFLNQGRVDPSNKTELAKLAQGAGVDLDKFLNCMEKEKYLSDIKKDVADAESYGITGTPTWFINGYKISGEIPKDIFLKIINEEILK